MERRQQHKEKGFPWKSMIVAILIIIIGLYTGIMTWPDWVIDMFNF